MHNFVTSPKQSTEMKYSSLVRKQKRMRQKSKHRSKFIITDFMESCTWPNSCKIHSHVVVYYTGPNVILESSTGFIVHKVSVKFKISSENAVMVHHIWVRMKSAFFEANYVITKFTTQGEIEMLVYNGTVSLVLPKRALWVHILTRAK